MTTFIKIGGSLITDKTIERHFRADVAQRLAAELLTVYKNTGTRLLIGHGSGSFGHYAAKRHGTMQGVAAPEDWIGFAEVGTVAAELSHLMTEKFRAVGLPIWRIQPSASAICEHGNIITMETTPIKAALANGIVPLIHGDVALDRINGGTIISTETIFSYLAQQLRPQRIIILGEVDGVLDSEGTLIEEITPGNLSSVEHMLGGSHGTDVTGGMQTKVQDMIQLVQRVPGLVVTIASGMTEDTLPALIQHDQGPGTRIYNPD